MHYDFAGEQHGLTTQRDAELQHVLWGSGAAEVGPLAEVQVVHQPLFGALQKTITFTLSMRTAPSPPCWSARFQRLAWTTFPFAVKRRNASSNKHAVFTAQDWLAGTSPAHQRGHLSPLAGSLGACEGGHRPVPQYTGKETVAYLSPQDNRGRIGHHLHTGVLRDGSIAYLTGAT